MNIDIYESLSVSGKYLGVPKGTLAVGWVPPVGFDPDFMAVRFFKGAVDVGPGSKAIGLDPAKVRAQISQHGWAVVR